MDILLINDTSKEENWGGRATSYALKKMIHEVYPSSHIHSIYLSHIIENPEDRILPYFLKERSGKITTLFKFGLNKLFFNKYDFLPYVADEFEDKKNDWNERKSNIFYRREKELIENCDFVIINGEGSIYGYERKGIYKLFLAYVIKKMYKKKVYLVNHTVDIEETTPRMKGMIKLVYPLLDDIVVRELESKKDLNALHIDNFSVAPDAVFSIKDEVINRELSKELVSLLNFRKPYITLTGSSIFGWTKWNPTRSYEKLVNTLKENFPETQIVIVAIGSQDYFLKEVASRTDSIFVGKPFSFRDIITILKNSDVFISGRFHPIIFSIMAGCPFVPMTANTHKIIGLCQYIKYPILDLIDVSNITNETPKLLKHVDYIYNNRDKIVQDLDKKSEQFKKKSYRNVNQRYRI